MTKRKTLVDILEIVTGSTLYRGDIYKDMVRMESEGIITRHERTRLMSSLKGVIRRSTFTKGMPADAPFEELLALNPDNPLPKELFNNWVDRFTLVPKKEVRGWGRNLPELMETIVHPTLEELHCTFYEALYHAASKDLISSFERVRLATSYQRYVLRLLTAHPDKRGLKEAIESADHVSVSTALRYYHKIGVALNWNETRTLAAWEDKWYYSKHLAQLKVREQLRSTRLASKKDTK